jgi:hypothetical protein
VPFTIAELPEERIELHPVEARIERILAANIIGDKAVRSVLEPQVFYVDMVDAHSSIKPHFHGVDQFQLVVRGGGTLGKAEVQTGSFHYADAFQPYGPIEAGAEGLAYLTIRARHDTGAHYMPGSGDRRTGRPRRTHFVETVDVTQRATATIAGPFPDGLEASRIEVPEKGGAAFAAAHQSDGIVGVVLDGEVVVAGSTYGRLSCFALSPGAACRLGGGNGGADVLVLQFPLPAVASEPMPGSAE